MKKVLFGGGCFWGVEEFFSRLQGVTETEVGYANGKTVNPTYKEICTNDTDYVEVCYITYDEKVISLETLLNKFWSIIDPTTKNRQGNDIGTQYRSGIYYIDSKDLDIINSSKETIQKQYDKPITTEIKPLKNYYTGEEYHQKYLKKNPGGYCHIKFD